MPDPREPRGVRHAPAVVLTLTSCAVLTGATSLPAVSEWIADAPPHVPERHGVRLDPVLPRRLAPSETAIRQLLARIDGDALDRAVAGRLADRRRESTDGQGTARRVTGCPHHQGKVQVQHTIYASGPRDCATLHTRAHLCRAVARGDRAHLLVHRSCDEMR